MEASDEGLPQGWTVEVRERRNGKKDKRYFPPSGNCIFNSMLEVKRYLEKEKCNAKKPSKNVALEKVELDGLPPGWTKEVKISKKGGKVRRDSFYTDPASGYIFRSLKDVHRYLETGEIGRLAKPPKDKGNEELDLDTAKTNLPAVAKKENLDNGETMISSFSNSSLKLCKSRNREQTTRDSASACHQKSCQCRARKEACQSKLANNNHSHQTEEKTDSSKSTLVSTPEVGAFQTKQPSPGTAVASSKKTKREKNLNQPRRTSKRLAGVPIDPTPELKITTRSNQAAVEELNEMVTGSAEGSSPDQGCSYNVKAVNRGNQVVVKELLSGSSSENRSVCTNNLSLESITKGNYIKLEDMVKDEFKCGPVALPVSTELTEQNGQNDWVSLSELWQDPCIAFAIKTLTGDVDTCDSTLVPPVSSYSGFNVTEPLRGAGAGAGTGTGAASIAAKLDRNSVSTTKLPVVREEVLADPCIDFAIKTLTGVIPLDYLPVQAHVSSGSSNAVEGNKAVSSGNNGIINQSQNVEERSRKRRK